MEAPVRANTIVLENKFKSVSETIVWKIEHFSVRPEQSGQTIESPKYETVAPNGEKQKWHLAIYPHDISHPPGCYHLPPKTVRLYVKLDESNEILAKCKFAILNERGEEKWSHSVTITKLNSGKTFACSIERHFLLAKANGLLHNDRLTIKCQLDILEPLETMEKSGTNNVPPLQHQCELAGDIAGNLWEKKMLADCVLVMSDKKEFQAHKIILACRSPVFAAMFQHETIEAKNNRVEITDIQSDIVEQMLHFIYTGTAPKLVEKADELLAAANKYQLMGLKLHCEHSLADSMGNENACELLILADLYSATHLKSQAMDFIKSHAKEVMGSAGWQTLCMEHSDLVAQILLSFSKQ